MLVHQFIEGLEVEVLLLHEEVEHRLEGAAEVVVEVLAEVGFGILGAGNEGKVFKGLSISLVTDKTFAFHDFEDGGDGALGRSWLGHSLDNVLEKGIFQVP